ncbi:MAG: protein translocase subunit SecDF, partial [Methyloligellaceae bacterium]
MLHFARWKLFLVLLVSVAGVFFALPNLFSAKTLSAIPDWIPHKQINLGLDLQGGAHLLYQIDEKELVEDWLKDVRGEVRDAMKADRSIRYRPSVSVPSRTVTVRLHKEADIDKALALLRPVSQPIAGNLFTSATGVIGNTLDVARGQGNTITLTINEPGLVQRISSAIESSIETIRRRIDAFGTTEPTIQRQGRDRILVQVPGIKDVSRLKALVGETGKLEFKLVDPTTTAQQAIDSKRVPLGSEIVQSTDGYASAYVVKSRAMVTGENLVDAQPSFDQQTREP